MYSDLYNLLSTLEREFPYSTMRESFRGRHAIMLSELGALECLLWSNGKAHRLTLSPDDLADVPKLVLDIKKLIGV